MKYIGFDKRECISKLTAIRSDIDKIIAIIGTQSTVQGREGYRAQVLLADLKNRLNIDYYRHLPVKSRDMMTPEETIFYYPAILEASAKIAIRTNSTPGRDWVSGLERARKDIEYYLEQLGAG
jgi:hypothetical protein